MTPLLVHLLFHPESTDARELANQIHDALNADPAVPGLRVPTVFAREDGTGLPPLSHNFNEAQRNLVVLLADDIMNADPCGMPSGRIDWSTFAGDLSEQAQTQTEAVRLVPVQLSEHVWPLDDRLCHTNFERAFLRTEIQERNRWVARRLVIQLLRYLAQLDEGQTAPVSVFVSHSKQDALKKGSVFDAVTAVLNGTDSPIKSWIDSRDIRGGDRFDEQIETGVKNSAVLALLTDTFSQRPWCKREISWAKRLERPIVFVDNLQHLDLRSFPYMGNTPLLRWGEDRTPQQAAQHAVDLLLKESLRSQVSALVLTAKKQPGDRIMCFHPELVTLVGAERGQQILYSDPPLGDEELELIAGLDVNLETPLQRVAKDQTLVGLTVALSMSESEDLHRQGLGEAHFAAARLEISRHLLVRGACLAYGGHLMAGGFTEPLLDLVAAHRGKSPLPLVERLICWIGWPLPLTMADRSRYKDIAQFERVPRPVDLAGLDPDILVEEPDKFIPPTSPTVRYGWARGMTDMRRRQVEKTDARILLGGKTDKYLSRIPGVLEEAVIAFEAGQPLYLVGVFGGVTGLIADLLLGKERQEMSWDYQRKVAHAEGMRAIYEQRHERWVDYPEMIEIITRNGIAGLNNGLSDEDNRELFVARDINRIVELLLKGLCALPSPRKDGVTPS